MTKNLITTLFFLSFLSFVFFIAKANNPNRNNIKYIEPEFAKNFSGIAKVLDGDSILVGKNEVRLFGIDAPEYKQECLFDDKSSYQCGVASFKYLKNLVNGQEISCSYYKKDVYDRFLAKCYLDDLNINKDLLQNGMAVIYNYHRASSEFKKSEAIAKNNKLGIWQGSFELPRNYRKRNKK